MRLSTHVAIIAPPTSKRFSPQTHYPNAIAIADDGMSDESARQRLQGHENQDECEGWSERSPLVAQGTNV
jgi:hypothetical protein